MSVYRIFGGLAFLLLGLGYFMPLPPPMPILIGICLLIAGAA